MQDRKEKLSEDKAIIDIEKIFVSKGKEVVRNGMLLILERLKFAKKNDKKIREAICAIEQEGELKSTQVKALVEALRHCGVMDTTEVLSLVTKIIERFNDGDKVQVGEREEVLVTLDERVKKWAQ